MQDDRHIWGADLKLLRRFAGLSVKEAADLYGTREYLINKYESSSKPVSIYYDVRGLIFNCFHVIRKKTKLEGIKGSQVQANLFAFQKKLKEVEKRKAELLSQLAIVDKEEEIIKQEINKLNKEIHDDPIPDEVEEVNISGSGIYTSPLMRLKKGCYKIEVDRPSQGTCVVFINEPKNDVYSDNFFYVAGDSLFAEESKTITFNILSSSEAEWSIRINRDLEIEVMEIRIDSLCLSPETLNRLNHAKIKKVRDLVANSEKSLKQILSIGDSIVDTAIWNEIENALRNLQLSLEPEESEERINESPEPSVEVSKLKNPLEITIEELDLSVRSYNCLTRAGLRTVADVIGKREDELMKIRNLGRKSLEEVMEKLEEFGFSLSEENDVQQDNVI